MQRNFAPSKGFPGWLRLNYATFMDNINRAAAKSVFIDISIPIIQRIWHHIEDDLLRSGINGVISDSPGALSRVSGQFIRILKPGFRNCETGYAGSEIIPVLSTFADCLALSNMAQMLDRRLAFLLRARDLSLEFAAGEHGLEDICNRSKQLPLVDFNGFFLQKPPKVSEVTPLKSVAARCFNSDCRLICPGSNFKGSNKDCCTYSKWENLALVDNSEGIFPLEIGTWAFPVESGADYQTYQIDLGLSHGLPAAFPARIGGFEARVVETFENFTELIINGHFQGPYPARCYLAGGSTHDPVDLHSWKISELRNFLTHEQGFPVYLENNQTLLEFLP